MVAPGLQKEIFDVVPCFIVVLDREFRVVEANRYFKESFGDPADKHCYEIYKKRETPCAKCPAVETLADGKMHYREDVVFDEAGHEVHVIVHTAAVRDAAGVITAVVEVSDDVTEIRTLQDRLAALGRLVGSTAHSIKNVLEGLRGGIYVGNLGFRDNKTEDIRTGWEMVERNVGRLSRMIMDMLYCAKERPPHRVAVDLTSVVTEVLGLYTARAAEFNIKLEQDISQDLHTIQIDPKDMHSLISNLLSNAIDACCSDQSEEKAYRVVVRAFKEGENAVIEVEDNGVGMDSETRSKLFTMFFSTKGSSGTGLGLLVSHKVATEHGGTISVKSAPGEGSTFTARIPLETKS
jgi:signal transduction histidine kinase